MVWVGKKDSGLNGLDSRLDWLTREGGLGGLVGYYRR